MDIPLLTDKSIKRYVNLIFDKCATKGLAIHPQLQFGNLHNDRVPNGNVHCVSRL
jgi:hypothetical protein